MLVLTRHPGQGLVIYLPDGRTIEIEVRGFKGGNAQAARLGVRAPEDIKILRDELVEAEQVKREWESLTTDLGGSHG